MREGKSDGARHKDHSKKRHFNKDEDQKGYELVTKKAAAIEELAFERSREKSKVPAQLSRTATNKRNNSYCEKRGTCHNGSRS